MLVVGLTLRALGNAFAILPLSSLGANTLALVLVVGLAIGTLGDTFAVLVLSALRADALVLVLIIGLTIGALGDALSVLPLSTGGTLALLGVRVVDLRLGASGLVRHTFAILPGGILGADTLLAVPGELLVVADTLAVDFLGVMTTVPALDKSVGVIPSLKTEVVVGIGEGLDRDGQGEKIDEEVLDMHDRQLQAFQQRKWFGVKTKEGERMEEVSRVERPVPFLT